MVVICMVLSFLLFSSLSRFTAEETMASVDADDKYTAAIEVSNACRMFYVSRLQTAETLKNRLVDRRRAVRAAAASSPPRGPDRHAGTVDDIASLESVVAELHKELVS